MYVEYCFILVELPITNWFINGTRTLGADQWINFRLIFEKRCNAIANLFRTIQQSQDAN